MAELSTLRASQLYVIGNPSGSPASTLTEADSWSPKLTATGDTLKKVLGIDNKKQFLQKFEVLDAEEQTGVSGRQKGRTTGSKRIVYAVLVDEQGKETRIPIMEKRQR